jgi:glycosyltransferase involved in cell wall biosynthesis
MNCGVGIIVPTMGSRMTLLKSCLDSIRKAGSSYIVIVTPLPGKIAAEIDPGLYDLIVLDPGTGLSEAINFGVSSLPKTVEFINWLGDDDLLKVNSILETSSVLASNSSVVLVYGNCDFIRMDGSAFGTMKAGRIAPFLMQFGPQLMPQPGSLFRRNAFESIGGLNSKYRWAFDLDLFIRLKQTGSFYYLNQTLAQFRWHDGSLTVGSRAGSVKEASKIRRAALPTLIFPFSQIWEFFLRVFILWAGFVVSRKARDKT